MAQYKTATPLSTSATPNSPRNKGVMIVNDGVGATEADVLFHANGGGTNEVTVVAAQNHSPIIIPVTLYKTGNTLTNCTVYELS